MSLAAAPLSSSRLNCGQGQKSPSYGQRSKDFDNRAACRRISNMTCHGQAQSDKRRPILNSISTAAILIACLLVQLVTILIVCQYDPSHQAWRKNKVNSIVHYFHRNAYTFPQSIVPSCLVDNLYPWSEEPSAEIFAVAVLIFSFASTTIHHLHDQDPFQNRIIFACVLLAVAISQLSSQNFADTIEKLRYILPVSIMAGLWLSATLHWIMRLFEDERPVYDALDEQQVAIRFLDEKDGLDIIV